MGDEVVVEADVDAVEEGVVVVVEVAVVVLKWAVNAIGIALSCEMDVKPLAS
jgi:hypothetical protein